MVCLERSLTPAISAAAKPKPSERKPLRHRVPSGRCDLTGSPPSRESAPQVAVGPLILREVLRKRLAMASVVGARIFVVFRRMSFPPPSHRGAGFIRIVTNPIASIGATSLRILVGHRPRIPEHEERANRTPRERSAAFRLRHLLRGADSNVRPLGYEPNELPLLHPARSFYPFSSGLARDSDSAIAVRRRRRSTARVATAPPSRSPQIQRSPARSSAPHTGTRSHRCTRNHAPSARRNRPCAGC